MSEIAFELPGKNCGACGFRSCAAMAERLEDDPDLGAGNQGMSIVLV